jgi:OmpA-OmpF porin, OOP family
MFLTNNCQKQISQHIQSQVIMSNKSLLLALLGLSLLGSAWWQKNKIMNCADGASSEVVATDSSTIAAAPVADTTMTVDTAAITEQALAESQKFSTVFKPMDLYFNVNDSNFIKTDDNTKFVAEAKAYLAENKDKTLTLTGHTDSDGADDANQRLSERRANDVKAQLVAKGFNADQLKTEAKGETSPIADNATADGKRMNRRVSIVVNQ